MKRTAILAAGLLLGHVASAAPNWQVTSFSMDPQNIDKVLAATREAVAKVTGAGEAQ